MNELIIYLFIFFLIGLTENQLEFKNFASHIHVRGHFGFLYKIHNWICPTLLKVS